MKAGPKEHHCLGPSNWPAWAECPCYESTGDVDAFDEREDHDETETDWAVRGTMQHSACACLLREEETGHGHLMALTVTEKEEVLWAVQRVFDLAREHGFRPGDLRIEQRVSLFEDDLQVRYFGTCDVRFGNVYIELKFGQPRNYFAQLAGYALPDLDEGSIAWAIAYVLYARRRRQLRWHIDRETARRIGYGILRKRENPYRKPQPCSYCGFCALKLACPAINAVVEHVGQQLPAWPALPTADTSASTSDPVLMGKMRFLAKAFLEKWCKAVDFASRNMAEGGEVPVGFEKRPRKGAKLVTRARAALDALQAAGVPATALEPVLKCSFGSLVDVYREAMGVTKAQAEAAVLGHLARAGAVEHKPETFLLRQLDDAAERLLLASAKQAELFFGPNHTH